MFYCQTCATQNEWPETMSKSRGACEVCGTYGACYDRAASLLPAREPKPSDGPDFHAEHAAWRDYNTRMFDAMMGYRADS
jgi:hypothetical protein